MRFRTLAAMTALITIGSLGMAAAQVAAPATGQVYNNSAVKSGGTPVFIAPAPAPASYYTPSSPSVSDIPSTPLKTAADIDARNQLIQQHNQTATQRSRAQYFAAYEASKVAAAQEAAAKEQAEALAQTNPATAAAATATANGQAAPAYLPPPVFTGKKKTDGDKPVRLFNVQ